MTLRFRRAACAGLCLAAGAAHAAPAVITLKSLALSTAIGAANAALHVCNVKGALVAVAVTDRSGQALVLLRDPLAGMHTPDTALRKAWTAASFRSSTSALEQATASSGPSASVRLLPGVAVLGGGLPILAGGTLVGAIGVSGAPAGSIDEACAQAGIDAVREDLELGS